MTVTRLLPRTHPDGDRAPSPTFALRCEAWDDGAGNRGGFIMLGTGGRCLVAMLVHDPRTRLWREALANLPPDWLRASLDDVWRALPTTPARNDLMRCLGLVDESFEGRARIRRQIVKYQGGDRPETGTQQPGEGIDAVTLDEPIDLMPGAPQHPGYRAMRALGIGDPEVGYVDVFGEASVRAVPVPDQPPSNAGLAAPPRVFRLSDPTEWTSPVIAPWHDAMEGFLRLGEQPFLTEILWSPAVSAYFSAPGIEGTYRRQAGTLYPFLAPAFLHEPGILALVDAGRPYEDTLAGLIGSMVSPRDADGFTVAKLRRLRGIHALFRPIGVALFLSAVSRLSLDTMPSDPEGWREFVQAGSLLNLDGWGQRRGLEIDDLVTHPGISYGSRESPPLDRIDDMIVRLEETLILPFLGVTTNHVTRTVAARLLFRGMGIYEILAVCNTWHARLRAFDGALPKGKDVVSWPALFAPWERGDWRIICLTLPSELASEGADGPDGEGMAGLQHCLGGYARKLYTGASHVLSIRRRTPEGWERVSTAEITVRPRDPMEHVVLSEVQHRGRANAVPPEDAKAAYDALMADLAYRRWAIADVARERRGPGRFDDGIDWSDPVSQESVLKAWRPYLSRRLAKLDVDAMKARLKAEVTARMGEVHEARRGNAGRT